MSGGTPAAAFFDLDHTLLDGVNGTLYARRMVAEGYMSRRSLMWVAWYSLLYKLNHLPRSEVYRKVLGIMGAYTILEIIGMMDRGFEQDILPRLYREGVDLVESHRERGHRTVVATAAGEYIAERVRAQLGANDIIATPLPVRGDRISTEMDGPTAYMEGKLEMARDYCARHGADLSDCYFYSDSASDLPLLEAVGNPVLVNPQIKLRLAVRGRGWPVLRFSEYASFEEVKRPERLLTAELERFNREYEESLDKERAGFQRSERTTHG